MSITRKVEVFNTNFLTKGSTIKLNGYSCHLKKPFENEIVEIVECSNFDLVVKCKGKKRLIEFWEYDIENIDIEMINRREPETVDLPF